MSEAKRLRSLEVENAKLKRLLADAMLDVIGRLRDECLNEHPFTSYRHARKIIEDWRTDYNATRPHTSLNGLTPRSLH